VHVYICKVVVPLSLLLASWCILFEPLSKRLKLIGAAYRRLEANSEETATKYSGSTDAYAKAEKIVRVMMNGGEQAEKARPILENQRPNLFCECLILMLKMLYIPSTFSKHET